MAWNYKQIQRLLHFEKFWQKNVIQNGLSFSGTVINRYASPQ